MLRDCVQILQWFSETGKPMCRLLREICGCLGQIGRAESYNVACEDGRTVRTSVHPGAAAGVRTRLAEMGLSETDVADAVRWARRT
jgi:hypothetical protein